MGVRGIKPITGVCQACGVELPPKSYFGRDRKWCSERCRKSQYRSACVDCGAPTNGSDGRGPNAPKRCGPCSSAEVGRLRKVWDRDTILDAIWSWAEEYGEPPAVPDWQPTMCRFLGDESRALRAENPRWPHAHTVRREFGSWSAAIEAAGFTPRSPHGGGGNQWRRRSHREKQAA